MALRRTEQFESLHRCDGHFHGVRLGEANVFASHADQSSRDVQRILAGFEHARQPIEGCVRIGIAHRLMQRRNQVEMLFAGLVVRQQLALQHVFQQRLRQHAMPFGVGHRAHHERLQSVVRSARISVRKDCDAFENLCGCLDFFSAEAAHRIRERTP